jgi:formate hydrogenlyase transcriptional activator
MTNALDLRPGFHGGVPPAPLDDPSRTSAARGNAFDEIAGRSPALLKVLSEIESVAATSSTVLICGETGTGKELVAKAIHARSGRCGPLVSVNCAALPASLLESELFGHEKGAFTGASTRRTGRFELAGDGTLFLDEVGELPLELQPKLLRAMQEREFERLGSSRTFRSNARVVAATNRDLRALVAENEFRSDLYYRLSVFPIELPPLRERREDIALLALKFAERCGQRMQKAIRCISPSSLARLERYGWPGNIRELQNVIERAVILSTGPELEITIDLPSDDAAPRGSPGTALAVVQRAHILAVLESTNWVVAGPRGAAARLGMKRSTLTFRMKKLGIERPVER